MSSQTSRPGGAGSPTKAPSPGPREPKRKRGHLRVAAILQTGVEVFAEKGYDAATMTEIAARSGTAIASLYRFFPSKEALADALLLQYAQHVLAGVTALRERAPSLSLDGIAGALIDFRLELQAQRSIAVALADARDGQDDKRAQFRASMLDALAAIVRSGLPDLPQAKAEDMAVVLLHVLKAVAAFDQEKPAPRRRLLAELKALIRSYLAAARAGDAP